MNMPKTLNDSVPVYNVHEPKDGETFTYSLGPAWLVLYTGIAALFAASLWTLTALVYWFVFMYGVIAGVV